ncbi:hypothetical protein FRB97_000408 [Tulasnella sp. 331]|nr:hypothetical protein FRB97_000408 [Tulasnella sp. 331]
MEALAQQPPETVANSAKKDETEAKLKIGREKKEGGDKAFKEALRQYHEVSLIAFINATPTAPVAGELNPHLMDAHRHAPTDATTHSAVDQLAKTEDGKSPKTEADILLEKLQSNICACHIKNENWKRAVETANQILKKSPENKKALLRKGKGLLGQGFTEKAIDVFQALEKQDPEDAEVKRELAAARAADKAATSKGLKKFKGFLNRPGASGSSGDVEEVTNVLEVSRIEEVS